MKLFETKVKVGKKHLKKVYVIWHSPPYCLDYCSLDLNLEDYIADMLMNDAMIMYKTLIGRPIQNVLLCMVETYKLVYQKATRHESLLYCIDLTFQLTMFFYILGPVLFVCLILFHINPGLPFAGDKTLYSQALPSLLLQHLLNLLQSKFWYHLTMLCRFIQWF